MDRISGTVAGGPKRVTHMAAPQIFTADRVMEARGMKRSPLTPPTEPTLMGTLFTSQTGSPKQGYEQTKRGS